MINLSKSYEYFQPGKCKSRIHIIGCGAVGSTVAENLVRFGITKITLWDFDNVEAHNIANQMFRECDIGNSKVDALSSILCEINNDLSENLKIEKTMYDKQALSGYIFLCVDNIETRKMICEHHKNNASIKGVFDFRVGLEDGQHYAADWTDLNQKDIMISTMNFTHEEASSANPVSACNITLSVVPTIREICSLGVANFINFIKSNSYKTKIVSNPWQCKLLAFPE